MKSSKNQGANETRDQRLARTRYAGQESASTSARRAAPRESHTAQPAGEQIDLAETYETQVRSTEASKHRRLKSRRTGFADVDAPAKSGFLSRLRG